MVFKGGTFIVLLIVLFNTVNCNAHDNYDEFYRPAIDSLINSLNQNEDRIYDYNYARLISAHNKNPDTTDLVLDVEVTCRNPDLCSDDRITCVGTVQYDEESRSYNALPGSVCQARTRMERPHSKVDTSYSVFDSPKETEEPKTIIRTHCLGCPEEVENDADGVDILSNVALQHIESESENKYVVLKVLRVQRQIVAGVKYTIWLQVAPTFCPKTVEQEYVDNCAPDCKTPDVCDLLSTICEITYFQQPWLNKNKKNIIANNCTHSQQFSIEFEPTTPKNDIDNEINPFYGVNPTEDDIISSLSLKELESQIMFKKPVERTTTTTTTTESTLSDYQRAAIEELEEMMSENFYKKKSESDEDSPEEKEKKHRNKRGMAGAPFSADPESPEIKKYVEDFLKGVAAERKEEFQEIKILSASKQIVSGIMYKFKIEIKKGDGKTTICHYQVWDQKWLKSKKIEEQCDSEEIKSYKQKRSIQVGERDGHDIHIGLFHDFILKHNKDYSSSDEFKKRFKIFRRNMKKVEILNRNELGTAKYGATWFADLTEKEFARYKGLKPELKDENNIPYPMAKIPDIELPVEFDWRKKGVISPVKDQGQCGSCWAFSVTGNIEGLYAIKNGKVIELSEQELVDCDKSDEGCNGGLMDNAYRAIEQMGGLETETDYPYEAEDEKCHFDKTKARVQISGAVNISTDETEIAKWLVKNGPISIGINANAMQFYMGGISHPFKFLCNPKNIDHGVLLVGYGVHKYPLFNKTLPYWIIKNSWGERWGEQGYYRVYRGDGTCGVNTMPESAIL